MPSNGELDWTDPNFEDEPSYEEMEGLDEPMSEAATVAFLDQQGAEFAAGKAQWAQIYGFDHNCHCSKDFTEGKVGTVTRCFLELTSQALSRCAEATHEIRVISSMLNEMLAVNNDLVKLMEDLGHTKELQEYFGETVDIEDEVLSEMELQFTNEGGPVEGEWGPEPTDEELKTIEDEDAS